MNTINTGLDVGWADPRVRSSIRRDQRRWVGIFWATASASVALVALMAIVEAEGWPWLIVALAAFVAVIGTMWKVERLDAELADWDAHVARTIDRDGGAW